jgi:GT2 family glycosyltransferase
MKIGAAIIACDRVDYTNKCIDSLLLNKRDLNEYFVVNDGRPWHSDKNIEIINNTPPYQTVGVAKNNALKELIKRGCDQLFLIENDMVIKSPDIFKKYIEARKVTGITHLNFGYHGPANRTSDYKLPKPRYVVEYPKGIKIALNLHSVGAFSYFDKKYIQEVGTHDVFFKNAWEHVELCQRGIKKGFLPAFWWFPDIEGSNDLIEEVPGSIQNSSITHTEEWTDNMKKGAEHYKKLHGWIPIHSPDMPLQLVLDNLKVIYRDHKL